MVYLRRMDFRKTGKASKQVKKDVFIKYVCLRFEWLSTFASLWWEPTYTAAARATDCSCVSY